MKGEYISIETLEIMSEIEKENKQLQERIDKARKCLEEYTEIVGKPLVGITANFIYNLEYILGDKENE